MEVGRRGKSLLGPLLAANLVVYLIILGLAGWSLDKYIDGEQNHPHLGGNPSTSFMLIFGLLSGTIGALSVFYGLVHLRAWRVDTLAAAASLAVLSCALTALTFGLVIKEMSLGGHRGKRLVRTRSGCAIVTAPHYGISSRWMRLPNLGEPYPMGRKPLL